MRLRTVFAAIGIASMASVSPPAPAHGKASMAHGTHRHAEWVDPPPEYAGRHGTRWADLEAALRGQRLYRQHCVQCHGEDGRGTGAAAAALAHKPADLTNHFHKPPHDGDAYLFWRVSEGGTVPPFSGMGSQMPAFKHVLSEDERWDVLTYVHVYFHLGLARWRMAGAAGSGADGGAGPRREEDSHDGHERH